MIELGDGARLAASQLTAAGPPVLERLDAEPQLVRQSSRFSGWKASVAFTARDRSLQVRWEIVLRDQSNYLQQRLVLQPVGQPVRVSKVTMVDAEVPSAAPCGESTARR